MQRHLLYKLLANPPTVLYNHHITKAKTQGHTVATSITPTIPSNFQPNAQEVNISKVDGSFEMSADANELKKVLDMDVNKEERLRTLGPIVARLRAGGRDASTPVTTTVVEGEPVSVTLGDLEEMNMGGGISFSDLMLKRRQEAIQATEAGRKTVTEALSGDLSQDPNIGA